MTTTTSAHKQRSVAPSSRKIDRFEKPAAYAAAGIPAYWRVELVKHRAPTIYCYRLDNGVHVDHAAVETGERLGIALPVGAEVILDVDHLSQLPRR